MTAQPGTRVEGMKPNGLVAAASITSQMSMPNCRAVIAISLARPMLTCPETCSRVSLTASAVAVDDTGTVLTTIEP